MKVWGYSIRVIGTILAFATIFHISFLINQSRAAFSSIAVSTPGSVFEVGESFTATAYASTPDATIDTAQGKIIYSRDLLELESITTRQSIVKVWVGIPEEIDGVISFSGGIPNPGYLGGGGVLFFLKFKVKAPGTATITVTEGRLLSNGIDIRPELATTEITTGRTVPRPSQHVTTTPISTVIPTSTEQVTPTSPTPTVRLGPNGEVLSDNDETLPEKPEIIDYLKTVTNKEKYFTVKGKTKYAKSEVLITVTAHDKDQEKSKYSVITDEEGNFDYIAAMTWESGKYTFWAEVVDYYGRISPRTDSYEFEIVIKKTDTLPKTIVDYIPLAILIFTFIALIVQLIRKRFENIRIKRHLEEAVAEVREERKNREIQAKDNSEDIKPLSDTDPRIKN